MERGLPLVEGFSRSGGIMMIGGGWGGDFGCAGGPSGGRDVV